MTKILLINPKFPESFWSFKWLLGRVMKRFKAVNPPLGLATLAALCPPDWEVSLVDENIESVPLHPEADIVGVCGMGAQFPRQKELLSYFRAQGRYVVAGGSFASLCPEEYRSLAQTVISGEAEYIWKQFCQDFEAGKPLPLYKETGIVDLKDSPVPRFDLLKLKSYMNVTLQFSRGCPFLCEFCDIIVMFGRKPRTKSPAQIGLELDAVRKLGADSVFFVDDNLIGDKPAAKRLLDFIARYQQQHHYNFHFGTEASLNLAQDEEMMRLMAKANFSWVFIGIETPDKEALKETGKYQNLREDPLESVRKIYRHGLDVMAGFIVGFDSDTAKTFDAQYRFITRSGIQTAMVGLLVALPNTPLHARLKKEGRLLDLEQAPDNTALATNIIPKNMTREQMIAGWQRLYRRLLKPANIALRMRNKLKYLKQPANDIQYPLAEGLKLLARTLKGGLSSGPFYFLHLARGLAQYPHRLPVVIQEWIIGMSMRDFMRRQLRAQPAGQTRRFVKALVLMRQKFSTELSQNRLVLTRQAFSSRRLGLAVKVTGSLDKERLMEMGRDLGKMLGRGKIHLTLKIEAFKEGQAAQFMAFMDSLAQYGDRIHIAVSENLQFQLAVDSSIFHVVMA